MTDRLLSLVVIFTQSIQLSKIVERFALLRVAIAPLGGLSIPAQGSTSETDSEAQPQADIYLPLRCYRITLSSVWWS